jgi:hypothetical protein
VRLAGVLDDVNAMLLKPPAWSAASKVAAKVAAGTITAWPCSTEAAGEADAVCRTHKVSKPPLEKPDGFAIDEVGFVQGVANAPRRAP